MEYYMQDCLVSGLCPSTGVSKKQHIISETGAVAVVKWKCAEAPNLIVWQTCCYSCPNTSVLCETPDDKKEKFRNRSMLQETIYNRGDEYSVLSPSTSISVWWEYYRVYWRVKNITGYTGVLGILQFILVC